MKEYTFSDRDVVNALVESGHRVGKIFGIDLSIVLALVNEYKRTGIVGGQAVRDAEKGSITQKREVHVTEDYDTFLRKLAPVTCYIGPVEEGTYVLGKVPPDDFIDTLLKKTNDKLEQCCPKYQKDGPVKNKNRRSDPPSAKSRMEDAIRNVQHSMGMADLILQNALLRKDIAKLRARGDG